MRNAAVVLGLVMFAAGPARAQEVLPWATKLFQPTTSHDFGTVARGAQLKYSFPVKNIYKVPLDISNIRVSCGCVSCTTNPKVLQPNEQGTLDVLMDGRRFTGNKVVSIFVTVGPDFVSTATLRVSANARQDVVFNPGTVNFGIVQRGQTPTQTLDVEYSGVLEWRIIEVVKNISAPFQVSVEEIYRKPPFNRFAGQVGYRFTVTLKPDAVAGPFKQDLVLKTNDPTSPTLMVPVEGTVQASLAVAPAAVQLGSVKVTEKATRKIIVRGSRPFRVLGVDGQGAGLTVEIPDRNAPVHILTVTYQPTEAATFHKQLTIRTDMDGESVQVSVDATAGQ